MANNLSAFVPQIWSKRIVQRINQINVMLPLVNRDYEGEIQQAGDTVWVRTFGDVVTGSYTRGLPISYNDLAPTKESLVVNQSDYAAIKVDDLDTAQNDINALDGYTGRMGVALNNLIETYLQTFYSAANAGNVVNNGGAAITITSSNAYTTIVSAQQNLDTQNLPQDGRWVVLTPAFKAQLMQDSKYFIRATDMGDEMVTSGLIPDEAGGYGKFRMPTAQEALSRGFFGKCAGFDCYMSNAVPLDGVARYCMYGQDRPISFASQLRNLEAIRLETTFATAVRGLLLYGGQVFAEYAKKLGVIWIANTQ